MSKQTNKLINKALDPLPLGAIKPKGWLKRQLEIQASGLTGHIDEFWEDLGPDNKWLGGDREGWERGPYYVDGLLPLAYLLEDEELQQKAEIWIEAFLKQDEQGWIGPKSPAEDRYPDYDPWPVFVVLKVLIQYYDVSRDERVIKVMTGFFHFLKQHLQDNPLFEWGKFRWGELLLTIYWLYERTSESWLLELALLVQQQGYDWQQHFLDFKYTKKSLEIQHETHVVNNAMGIKTPGLWYRQSGEEADRRAIYKALENLDKFHGQVSGVFSGDEHLSGKNPSQGTELCAVVEYIFSLEKLISVLGDSCFADRLEQITYNALPATFTPDMWAHQYDQQANQVICSIAERNWTNDPDANIFGLEPNFGCCTANMHQGWPKFVRHMWMKLPEDRGLSAVAYGPCRLETNLGKQEIVIQEKTDYPFAGEISFELGLEQSSTFVVNLRIPGWAEGAEITLPDGEICRPPAGDFFEVAREWQDGDIIMLQLPLELRSERRHLGGIALHRGPLVYSLKIEEDWKQIGGKLPHADWEVYPTTPWNYALKLSPADPEQDIIVEKRQVPATPFSPEGAPVELMVKGQYVADWKLENNWAGALPQNPIKQEGQLQDLTLIPYGCTNLRISEFPILYDEE